MLRFISRRLKQAVKVLLRGEGPNPVMNVDYQPEIKESSPDDSLVRRATELAVASGNKLNMGCGTDYRKGFINIDGSDSLSRVDQVIDLVRQRLDEVLGKGFADYVLANDIVEHMHHWEAVNMLDQFYQVLKPGGVVQIRVPDCEYIIAAKQWSIEEKLVLLFGGQDVPQGHDTNMDLSRQSYPQFFCHEYGWTMKRLFVELERVGFRRVAFQRAGSNFVAYAMKNEVG